MKRIVMLVLLFAAMNAFSQPAGSLRGKVITLHRFLEQNHYSPLKWNDSTSALLYHKWIEKLDDDKLLFTQPEINALESFKNKLDDEILGKGWDFYNRSTAWYSTC